MDTAPKTISHAEATRRFVQFAAKYAIVHHVGWLLDAGVDMGLMQEEVDINGEFGVQLMPWVESAERTTEKRVRKPKRTKKSGQRRRARKVDSGHDQEMLKPELSTSGTNVFPIKKVDNNEVDRLRRKGMTHEEIAEHLGVSTKTVQRRLRGMAEREA